MESRVPPLNTADRAAAITLRVNTPPAEIGLDPGVRNGRQALTRKLPDLFKALPGVLREFEALRPLGLRFLDGRGRFCAHILPQSLLAKRLQKTVPKSKKPIASGDGPVS